MRVAGIGPFAVMLLAGLIVAPASGQTAIETVACPSLDEQDPFTLVHALEDSDIRDLSIHDSLDIEELGTVALTLRANTSCETRFTTVRFDAVNITTGYTHQYVDRDPPFSMCGNSSRLRHDGRVPYWGCARILGHSGNVMITATPSASYRERGQPVTMYLDIINGREGHPGRAGRRTGSPGSSSPATGETDSGPVITDRDGEPITDGIVIEGEVNGNPHRFDLPQGWLETEADRLCDLGGSGYSIGMSINVECP